MMIEIMEIPIDFSIGIFYNKPMKIKEEYS